MLSPSDLNFASVRAKTGRAYHVNPYYVAAWSTLFQERFCNGIGVGGDDDLIYCPCSNEELKYFLMAIYPPQLRITESNIAPILMAACKLESHGLLRKCATILLSSQTQLSVFVRLSLLDRCRLQELLEQYECLSTRAKSAMMDRFAQLVNIQGIQQFPLQSTIHICTKCKSQFSCSEIAWQCSQCKTFISSTLLAELSGVGRQNRQGSQSGINPSPLPINTSPSHTTQQYGRNIVSSRR
uniref:BTB domain-containing protein n=1 Tax=Meloidogyne javanica TaxID=6303 RepID=A0A915N5N4_MELJA